MFIRRDEEDIDRIFRQRLKHAEEPFPSHLWEGIRQRSSRKRRIPPYWFVAAALIAGAIGFGMYYTHNQPTAVASQNSIHVDSPRQNNPSQPEHNGNSKAGNQLENLVEEPTPKQTETPETISQSKAVQNTTANTSGSLDRKKGKSEKNSASAITTLQGKEVVYPVLQAESHQIISETKENDQEIETVESLKEAEGESDAMTAVPTTDVLPAFNIPKGEETFIEQPTELTEVVAEEAAAIESPATDAQHMAPNRENELPLAPVTYSASRPIMLGVYAAAYRAHRQINSGPEGPLLGFSYSEDAPLNISDGDGQGISLGVGLQYALSKWFYLGTGIEYSRLKERTHYKDLYLVGIPTYVNQLDTSWLFTETDTSVMLGTSTVASDSIWHTSQKTALIFNSYQSLNLPLTAGVSWNYKRLMVGLEAGPVFRLGKTYTGKFRYDDKLLTSESLTSDNPYEQPLIQEGRSILLQEVYTKWNIDWHAALRLGYHLSPHFSVQGGVQYRMMKDPAKHADTGEHRIVMPGVNLGLYYRF